MTLKHWDAYSLENSDNFTRYNFNAVVSPLRLQDTYYPAFKAAIQAGAAGIMCSYNAVNGIPMCANKEMADVLLSWGFSGYITSDTDAITNIWQDHHYVPTAEQAACVAITNGSVHINSGTNYREALLLGVQKGFCNMSDVDKALRETLGLRFKLGLLDPIEDQPYWHIGPETVNSSQSFAVNLLMAEESMVLLKNEQKLLPLKKGSSVAVIGPHYDAQAALVGNYLGQLCVDDTLNCVPSLLEAISHTNVGGETRGAQGCYITGTDSSGFEIALELARSADFLVLVLGIDTSVEAESLDRTSIDLPKIQRDLARNLSSLGKPTVLVLINGGMLAIAEEMVTSQAILSAGYPGFRGASAIARTLFGDNEHLGKCNTLRPLSPCSLAPTSALFATRQPLH